jgi:hypothetical protein
MDAKAGPVFFGSFAGGKKASFLPAFASFTPQSVPVSVHAGRKNL